MKIYLVGGAVRDKLLHLPIREKDYVVVGATIEEMKRLGYRQVGKEFPVFLHPDSNEEYALARMERKINLGYKGFTFDTSTHVTLEEDLLRRDLTINAMAIDLETNTLIDPYGGQKDLDHRLLRHVSPAFAEDPVRILRIGRFLARFSHLGFRVAEETITLMRKMVQAGEANALVAERVWKELERALSEKNPENFFDVLYTANALPILFPHLDIAGPGIQALKCATNITQDITVRFAALLHAIPEEIIDKTDAKKNITALCHLSRAPNAYRELAILTALHHQEILKTKSLSAKELGKLFATIDIFRREERFHRLLQACQAIADLQNKSQFDIAWLKACAQTAKSVDIQQLLAQGLAGQTLANQLKEKREEAIEKWLK